MNKKVNFIFIICLFLIVLTGCSRDKKYSIEDKVTEEIKYIENILINIVNNFATGNYEVRNTNLNDESNEGKENDIENLAIEIGTYNTESILEDTRKIEEASNRIMVDLAIENIDNEDITKFSDGINKMLINISKEDEREYLVELNNVFALLPNFEAKISNNVNDIFERRIKYFTISSFISFSVGDKELAKSQVEKLENEYLEKQKVVEYVEEHKYNLNKIYLLIQELKKAIETDSEALVKEKYLLLIDEI
ncbi:MAG: hypothetical protein IKM97_02290 [Clostridia bacterium]|nr:hypothetical protein [Clostridia bacterium]